MLVIIFLCERGYMHFLVDFENVGLSGLVGIESLKRNDSLYIFHNAHRAQLPIKLTDEICKTGCHFFAIQLVRGGKNALDFYIAAKVGELCAKGRESICILSNDRGFAAVQDYIYMYFRKTVILAGNISGAFEDLEVCRESDFTRLCL